MILRGFVLTGAGAADNLRRKAIGAIDVIGGHNILIEDCDISDWGRTDPATGFGFDYDSAIFSRNRDISRLIIQRCRLHHPSVDTNTWSEPKRRTHPAGPQCISLVDNAGNHIIRYNECWSDLDHMFNDVVGGGGNASYRGSPGPDSDIYGNFISHCWDDGLEVEGGSRNVRVWDNYITQCMNMIGNAPASIGPLDIWRNVVSHSQSQPDDGGMHFLKMGYADGEQWMTGQRYVFHNTLFRADGWLPVGGLGGDRIVKQTVSRNNILHVRSSRDWSASAAKANADNDFDYDLYNGRIPDGQVIHGVRGEPVYLPQAGFDVVTKTGIFQLAPGSPGTAAGQFIPNYSGTIAGGAPDIGAHQPGDTPRRFGVSAAQR